uniref:Vesicle transport protein n=1 Tax=Plectus sambesii TaxID=2011161 RepID=A0A914X202_9BILA
MLGKFKRAVGMDEEQQQDPDNVGIMADINDATTLSWNTRLQAFAGFFALGLICSLLGSLLLVKAKLTGFCVLTSLGSILSLASTTFLMGPFKQLKKMFDPVRLVATIVYIGMIVLTVVAGLVWKSPPLAFIFVIGQYVAMAWYSLSYIPYARDAVSRCVCACVN